MTSETDELSFITADGDADSVDNVKDFVIKCAHEQKDLLLRHWGDVRSLEYKDSRDLVSETDREVERNIRAALTGRYPGTGFTGEELEPTAAEGEYVWYVDPIDGSKYYAGGAPLFATTVALVRGEEPVLGVIYFPAADQTFWAYSGSGVYLNGNQLTAPTPFERLDEAIILVDVTGDRHFTREAHEQVATSIAHLVLSTYRVRMYGLASAAAYLATGIFDAWVELGIREDKWMEFMALLVIVREAGFEAQAVDLGLPSKQWVIGKQGLIEQIREVLESVKEKEKK